MAQQTTGRAALVANNLPSGKTVSAATNATPIVVTTTTSHGLQTNEIFTISGVLGNTAANGTFVAGTVTPTTVALLAYPGGTSVAGSGAYLSGGTLQSLGFGVTVPVPVDLTDSLRAGTPNIPFEACLDRLAYLMLRAVASSVSTHQLTGNPWNETVTNDGTYYDTNALVNFIGCKVGDIIVVSWAGGITIGGTGSGGLRIGFRDDFAGTNVLADTATIQWVAAITSRPTTNFSSHTVTVAGTTRVVIRMEASAAANITMDSVGTLLAVRFQPDPT